MTLETSDFELTPQCEFIRGYWLDLGSSMEKDSGWQRILWLIENSLQELARKADSHERLYRHPADNSLWHYQLVTEQLHNGPPQLQRIDEQQAGQLFTLS